MKTTRLFTSTMVIALIGVCGCAARHKPDSAMAGAAAQPAKTMSRLAAESDFAMLQGTWKGQETGDNAEGPCYLMISGKSIEFRAPNPTEWYKGTFSLRLEAEPKRVVFAISGCAAEEYVGKTSFAI